MPAANPIKSCPGCENTTVRMTLTFEQQCSPCRKKERHRIWREANPGATAANAKRWREAGNVSVRPEGYAEQRRAYANDKYHNDPITNARAKASAAAQRERKGREVLNTEHAEWLRKNPGKTRQYYEATLTKLTPEERKLKGQMHRVTYRVQRQANTAAYNARRHNGNGEITNEHLYALHKWQDHCCFYCRYPLGGAETIEHVVPLSRHGSNNPWNVTLACGDCNNRKNNRIFHVEWRPDTVAETPRIHSLFATAQLKKTLTSAGIAWIDENDHLMIRDRPVFMLSSFWLGWKGDSAIIDLKSRCPTAMLFFDKEFVRRPEAIVNVLKAKAGIAERIGARKLILDEPTPHAAREFMGRWHAMGATGGTHYLGLRDDEQWWIVAAFKEDADRYEIIRMAIRETVAGGVSRIISHFRQSMPKSWPLVAFTDQRMGDGKSHFFANFKADGMTERSFFYATPEANGFHPRRDFQKQVLEDKGEFFDPEQTQGAIARANGLMRVEGLPRLRFVLNP